MTHSISGQITLLSQKIYKHILIQDTFIIQKFTGCFKNFIPLNTIFLLMNFQDVMYFKTEVEVYRQNNN
jgi:hypothetical protein